MSLSLDLNGLKDFLIFFFSSERIDVTKSAIFPGSLYI
jgi:hypothetical protein